MESGNISLTLNLIDGRSVEADVVDWFYIDESGHIVDEKADGNIGYMLLEADIEGDGEFAPLIKQFSFSEQSDTEIEIYDISDEEFDLAWDIFTQRIFDSDDND